MAAYRGSSSPDSSNPISRPRHARHDSRPRRPRGEHSRCPAPRRSTVWSPQQLPTPMTTPNSSTLSLGHPMEHHRGITMERTPSGNSIMSDTPFEQQPNNTLTCSDDKAAHKVKKHFRRLPADSKHARILHRLIKRDDQGATDNEALEGIVTAMDSVFFNNKLSGRVEWEWSSQDRYQTELIGTTALRPRADGDGFETLIILSQPILTNPHYDRRLLLSAFIHELIHCYLFIMCGFDARIEGGHTKGFHTIAELIDNWVEPGYLSLCNMQANLNFFRRAPDYPMPIEAASPRFMESGWRYSSPYDDPTGCIHSHRPSIEYYEEHSSSGYGFYQRVI